MIILGVDPGKRTGYSFFDTKSNGEIRSGVLDGDDFVLIGNMLKQTKPDLIQVEDPFLGYKKNKPALPSLAGCPKGEKRFFSKAYAKLKFYVWAWEIAAKTDGVEFAKPVHPATWQAYWKIQYGDKEGMRRLVSSITGKEIEKIQQDEADATLIARWAASNLHAKETIKRAIRGMKS